MNIEFEGFDELAKAFEGGLNAPILDGTGFDIDCPKCSTSIAIKIHDLTQEKTLQCPGCGANIQLQVEEGETS